MSTSTTGSPDLTAAPVADAPPDSDVTASPTKDYTQLTKARLSGLVVATTAVGVAVASPQSLDWALMGWTVLGTGLAAGGANALNECIEIEYDRRMPRTSSRPLPAGRMSRGHGLAVALALSVLGPVILAVTTNALTAGLAVLTTLLYALVYTPLKRRDPSCTLVGAIVGAIPPMMGWTAVTGSLAPEAWVLFLILFIWQIPHFLALAWMYRDEYAQAGFRMLPLTDPSGMRTTRLIVIYSAVLIPLSATVLATGMAGWGFGVISALLGGAFVTLSIRLFRRRSVRNARLVFLASLLYLPLLLGAMVIDRGPAAGLTPWTGTGFTIVSQPQR